MSINTTETKENEIKKENVIKNYVCKVYMIICLIINLRQIILSMKINS